MKERTGENPCELTDYVDDYEDETGLVPVVPPSRRFERAVELADDSFRAWLAKRLVTEEAVVMAAISSAMDQDGIIRGWRVLTAPEDWTPALPNCGVHWSLDRDCAMRFRADNYDGSPEHLIEATIPFASVD